MNLKRLLCVGFCMSTAAFSFLAAAPSDSAKQMVVSIKLKEKVARNSKVKVLAEPSILATIGKPFSYFSGGTVKATIGDGELEFGTRVSGKIERLPTGAVQLVMKMSVASETLQPPDRDFELNRTETLEIRTVLHAERMKRVECRNSQWCELQVDYD